MIKNDIYVNNVIGSVIVLDEQQRIHVKGTVDGLLDAYTTADGKTFKIRDEQDGSFRLPDAAWFDDMLRQGRLRLCRTNEGVTPEAPAPLIDHDVINTKDPRAGARLDLVRKLAAKGVHGRDPDLSGHIDMIWDEEMVELYGARPKTSTARAWMDRTDPLVATLEEMYSRSGRVPRARQLHPEVIKILDMRAKWFYANKGRSQKDVKAAVFEDVDAQNMERAALGLAPHGYPGKETIRRAINDNLNRDTHAEKWGEASAKARWDGAGKSLKANRILAIGIIDDTVLDGVVVMDGKRNLPLGRPWLCLVLDANSRCVPGYVVSFVPPSLETATLCLRRANRPKLVKPERLARWPVLAQIGGRFDVLLCDNAKNYASPKWQRVLADVGTNLRLAPVGAPTYKAMVERFFRTLNTWLLAKLPGATFDPALLREMDFDPAKDAVLTLTELEHLIDEFIFTYHIEIHSALAVPPALKWQTSMETYGRNVIADERRLTIATSITLPGRRLHKGAIRLFGLTFRDRLASAELNEALVKLEPHRSRNSKNVVATVDVKYDPGDLKEVHVLNRRTNEWVTLPCSDFEYADGLSEWQHKQIQAWATRQSIAFATEKERLAARHALNKRILELAPDMADRERRAVARMLGRQADPSPDLEIAFAEPRHDGMAPVLGGAKSKPGRCGDPSRPAKAPANGRAAADADPRDIDDDCDLAIDHGEVLFDAPGNDDEKYEHYQ